MFFVGRAVIRAHPCESVALAGFLPAFAIRVHSWLFPPLTAECPQPTAVFHPKSKELSAFPKTYPLRNRAIGAEMTRILKNPPGELAEAVGAAPCLDCL